MGSIYQELNVPRQNLQAKVEEGPNKHFSLVPNHKNDIYICKSAKKMAKIGTLGASAGGQDFSLKSFG
jgi:hypothetical protein